MEKINPNIVKLKLPKSTIVTYGLGDFASNLCWSFIGSYLTLFYTNYVGMAPALAALIMMVARIFDAVWDPTFGAIAERTHTRFGRFRPYIIYGAPALAIFSILSFVKVGSGTMAFVFSFLSYFICGLLYSVVNLSYGSLSSVMTTNQDDLAQLNSYRSIGQNLSSLLITALTPTLLLFFSGTTKNPNIHGYLGVALLFAVLALPMFWFLAYKCKENIKPVTSNDSVSIRETLKAVLSNKPLLLLFLMMLISMLAMFGRFGVLTYYVIYCIGDFKMIALFMTLPSVAAIVGIFVTKNFVAKIGRKKMVAAGYVGAGLCLICMFLVGELSNYKSINILLVLDTIFGLFYFALPIPMAMVTDVINYGEDKFGIRSDGVAYAAISLASKLGSAFGASIGLGIMGITGYVANHQQTTEALTGINVSANLIMGLLWILAAVPLIFYPLTEKINNNINERLTKKRENIDLAKTNISKNNGNVTIIKEKNIDFYAMVSGDLLSLNKIEDPVSGEPLLGNGFGIIPYDNKVYSPTVGQVINVFLGQNAIGIRAESGLEFLIHLGVNTADLHGEPFNILVKVGDRVDIGTLLANVDINQLKAKGKGTAILLLITTPQNSTPILLESRKKISAGELVIHYSF